jgi:hypothetical protein
MSDFRHDCLSSILGNDAEMFSLDDCDQAPTFREQKDTEEKPLPFFFTEKQQHERREANTHTNTMNNERGGALSGGG